MEIQLDPKLIAILPVLMALIALARMGIPVLSTDQGKRLLPPLVLSLAWLSVWLFMGGSLKDILANTIILTGGSMALWSGTKAMVGK